MLWIAVVTLAGMSRAELRIEPDPSDGEVDGVNGVGTASVVATTPGSSS